MCEAAQSPGRPPTLPGCRRSAILSVMPFPSFHKILALALVAALLSPGSLAAQMSPPDAADALLTNPTLDLPQTRQALVLLEGLLPGSGSERPRLLALLARGSFILGDLAEKKDLRQEAYEKGRTYAEMLLKEEPSWVAGHYWLGLNLAGLADVGGALEGRRLLPRILEELQRSLALNEAYDQAGAHRTLGRIYYEAPRAPFSVGDLDQSLKHLTAAVRLAPECSTNHLYLAETLLRLGQTAQFRQELERVLTSPRPAWHAPGLQEDQREARRLLAELEEK
jgi:tetratricopeptide (TPR) repeat protein